MADRTRQFRPVLKVLGAGALTLALCVATPAINRQRPDVPPPPKPADNFVKMTEAEVLAKLPDAERHMVSSQNGPRERFQAILDVSDVRLSDVGAKLDAGAPTVLPELLLYEALIRIADDILRSPAAKVPVRDKLFKRFERRLGKQLALLKTYETDYRADDSSTGTAVTTTVTRIRTSALHSALGVEMLETPDE